MKLNDQVMSVSVLYLGVCHYLLGLQGLFAEVKGHLLPEGTFHLNYTVTLKHVAPIWQAAE